MQNLDVRKTTKLNQFVPNFNWVEPRHSATLPLLDISISAIAMM